MDLRERQQRILANQFLTLPEEKLAAASCLNGIQAQFLSFARHALSIRSGSRWKRIGATDW